jgi:pyruvate/2-oxoglutarate dehydrogenase complex dihydrolipoamide dehydrogenase (E3) component
MSGHEVTLLEMQDKLAPNASVLYREGLLREIEASESLRYILNARCTGIDDGVSYTDAEGAEHKLEAGTVVIAAGMNPRVNEAMAFYEAADRCTMVGDCSALGNVEGATHTAFSTSILL